MALGRAGGEDVEFLLPAFEAAAGDRVALTGPSGCGKSTLLNIVAGLRRPDARCLDVLGNDLLRLSSGRIDALRGRRMGFVYQSFNLLDALTAEENVLVGLRFGRAIPHGQRRARAREVLGRVGLGRRSDLRVSRLSVGERQRVAIARAIANRPALLLADEPTGSLDPDTARTVFQLLQELCAEYEATLLFVTHDLDLAADLPRRFDCRGLVRHCPAGGQRP